MNLWRISNYADLLGVGALGSSGRWHHAGKPVVYLAENPSSALLEILVHLEVDEDELPENYQLLAVLAAEGTRTEEIDVSSLPVGWEDNLEHTRKLGDRWLDGSPSALLRVPSAITPATYNWLFNPRHPDAPKVTILKADKHRYDTRLFRWTRPVLQP